METPRGIRNNNPGNIRKSADPWQGLADDQPDPAFFTFKTPAYGIRALSRILITYQDKHGLDTIRQIICRWAPPSENDTESYVRSVAKSCDLPAELTLDLHDDRFLRPLVEAIIRHENGVQPYSEAQITKGLVLAGVEPPAHDSLTQSRTVRGGQLAGVGAVASVAAGAMQDAQPAIPFLRDMLHLAPWLVGVIILAGVGYMVWARIDDRRRGLR